MEDQPLNPPTASQRAADREELASSSARPLLVLACVLAVAGGASMVALASPPTATRATAALRSSSADTLGTCAEDAATSAVDYFQCPPGAYLGWSAADKAKADARLRALYQTLAADPDRVENPQEGSTGMGYQSRGYATFESQAWRKPAHCSEVANPSFLTEVWRASYNGSELEFDGYSGQLYKSDTPPTYINKVVSDEYNFEFHYSWKVASTSFPSFLYCEFWPLSSVSESTAVADGYKVAGAVRHPLSRFVSGVLELLERSVNFYCPSGYCTLEHDGFEGNVTLKELDELTTWYQLVKHGVDDAALPQLLGAFVHDVECNYEFYASEHFTSQATFLTQGQGCAADLGPLVRLEELDAGLDQLVAELKVEQGGAYKNCTMKDSNEAADKPGGLPTEGEMQAVLEQNAELMQRLCKIYAQDFVCFGYDLPEQCAGLF